MPIATFAGRRHEYDDVFSFWFRQPRIRFAAGQYAHVQLGVAWKRLIHELSFASAPFEEEHRFTVHLASGTRFKLAFDTLSLGDPIRIAMVRGRMVLPRTQPAQPLVLIGGGVGMAPLRSLILEARRRGWSTPEVIQVQRGDYLYGDEFAQLGSRWCGVRPDTFLDVVSARASAGSARYYVCGSTRLATAARRTLQEHGVDPRCIRTEDFG